MTKEEFKAFVAQTIKDEVMTDKDPDWNGIDEDSIDDAAVKITEQWETDIFNAWKLGERAAPGLPQGVYLMGEDL